MLRVNDRIVTLNINLQESFPLSDLHGLVHKVEEGLLTLSVSVIPVHQQFEVGPQYVG